jgi:SAM-dependent methyltransferase
VSCYGTLAAWYDELTCDIPYTSFADCYEKEFSEHTGEFKLLLDLFCGTGTLTNIMVQRGYDMIAVDASEDMLMQARNKFPDIAQAPLFLCQEASNLDLYGTVDAAYSSLDGINYIPPEELQELFHRLFYFVRPAGLFIFDIRSPEWIESMDGQTCVDEHDDVLCLWRSEVNHDEKCINYDMDIFSKKGDLWERTGEEHTEYIYSFEYLKKLLISEGFHNIKIIPDGPQHELGRITITAERIS